MTTLRRYSPIHGSNIAIDSDVPVSAMAWFLPAIVVGFVLPFAGAVGQLIGFALFVVLMVRLALVAFRQQLGTHRFNLCLGFLVGGQIFFRDYVIKGFVGYLVIEYALLGLAVLSLPFLLRLLANGNRVVTLGPWILLCVWSTVSLSYSPDPLLGRWFIALYSSGLVTFFFALAACTSARQNSLLDGLTLGACLTLGIGLNAYLKSPEDFLRITDYRLAHALTSAVQIGIVMCVGALSLFLRMSERPKIFRVEFVVAAILTLAGVVTFSRGPVLGLLFGLVIIFLTRRALGRQIRLILALAIIAFTCITLVAQFYPDQARNRYAEMNLDEDRVAIWNTALAAWRREPWLGWGVGSWARVYPVHSWLYRNGPGIASDAHNVAVQIAVELGLIGLLLFGWTCANFAIAAVRARSKQALAMIMFTIIVGLVENWKLPVLYLVLGLGYGLTQLPPVLHDHQQLPRQ